MLPVNEEIENKLDKVAAGGKIPRHVAIIMDGNGRWACKRDRPRDWGHQHGVGSVRQSVETAARLGIEVLTLYAFSEENWGRPAYEVKAILGLIDEYVRKETGNLKKNNIRLKIVGNIEKIPDSTRELLTSAVEELSVNTGMTLMVALSYGGRQEILEAFRSLAGKVLEGELLPDEIDAQMVGQNLWTKGIPDPDLLIRTSGEQRISNLLLWQMAYTELYFTPVLWPDFKPSDFVEAILDYQTRQRRFGYTGAQVSKLDKVQQE